MKHGSKFRCGATAVCVATVTGKPHAPQLASTFKVYYCPVCDKLFWRRVK